MRRDYSKGTLLVLVVGGLALTSSIQAANNTRNFPSETGHYKYKYTAEHLAADEQEHQGISRSAIKKGEVIESEFLRFMDKEYRAMYQGLGDEGKRLARTLGAEELKESSNYTDPNFNSVVEQARDQMNQKAEKVQGRMLRNGMERFTERKS